MKLRTDEWTPAVAAELERADRQNYKRGAHVELPADTFIILRSPDGARWKITVSNAGVLSAVAV